MIRIFRYLLLIAIIGLTIYGLNKMFWPTQSDLDPVASTPSSAIQASSFTITTLQITDDERQFLTCQANQCITLTPVASSQTPSVTDGESWYHYTLEDDKRGLISVLKRTWPATGDSTTIVSETPLVSPRGLIISPDNLKVAYWLDNQDQPRKKLTELWTYVSEEGGTKLLAEKLFSDAVVTRARWNSASNYLWFIGETAESGDSSKPALHLVSLHPPSVTTAFNNVDWSKLQEQAQSEPMDINSTGTALAYPSRSFGRHQLNVVRDGASPVTTTVSGPIRYLYWQPSGTLTYITEEKRGLTVWQQHGTIHRHLTHQPGQLIDAKADPTGQHLIVTTKRNPATLQAIAIDLTTGIASTVAYFPTRGQTSFLVDIEATPADPTQVAGITSQLDNEELAAFIDKNVTIITQDPNAKPIRLLTTDQANVIYLDYTTSDKPDQRLLLTINDAIHDEWSIRARYIDRASEWVRVAGAGLKEPTPAHLYEWESDIEQWILKENY